MYRICITLNIDKVKNDKYNYETNSKAIEVYNFVKEILDKSEYSFNIGKLQKLEIIN